MLSIGDPRLGRRDFLRVGGLALGGLSLSSLFPAVARADAGKPVTDKSVVFLFLHGGPSQFETFDPKMSAPDGIRSVTGEIPTAIPGVTFGSTFTKLASRADKFAVLRSYRPGDANHDIKPVVHKQFMGANLGSVSARVAGMNDPVTVMPTTAVLYPQSVDKSTQAGTRSFGDFASAGGVGAAYAPFVPGGAGNLLQNMQLKISRDKL